MTRVTFGPGARQNGSRPVPPSATPSWTLTAALFAADTSTVPGLVENWALTCEIDGQVRQRMPVEVDRGQQVTVDLCACGRG